MRGITAREGGQTVGGVAQSTSTGEPAVNEKDARSKKGSRLGLVIASVYVAESPGGVTRNRSVSCPLTCSHVGFSTASVSEVPARVIVTSGIGSRRSGSGALMK